MCYCNSRSLCHATPESGRGRTFVVLVAAALLLVGSPEVGADESHGGHGGHGDDLHFSHPLITESPSPDTKVRFDYFFADGEEEEEGELRFEGEYAFHRSFSIEVDVPYIDLSPEGEESRSHLGNVGLGFKFANFAFADRGLLLGYGIEFRLPTGSDEDDIGSDNVFEIAPVLSLGYKKDRFELVGFFEFGIPTNQDEEEEQEVETELEISLSILYHVSDRWQALLEVDGETVLSGDEEGETVFNLTPGFKVRPVADSSFMLGLGVGFPLTNEEEFDTRVVVSGFYHF